MGFRESLQKRIEEGAIKSVLNGEIVYLKKSKLPLIGDWARIYPPINENGSINWINLLFGGKKNLIRLLMIFTLIVIVFLGFYQIFSSYEAFRNIPCVKSCIDSMMGQSFRYVP